MKINWAQKLTSRKLWVAIIGIVVGVASAFGIDGNAYAEVAGIVTSAISVFAYIFGEAKADAERIANSAPINITIEGDETDDLQYIDKEK